MTERVGLLGWPVAHSVSPAMHNAAFAALGLDWRYDLLPVAPDRFAHEVARLVAGGYRGLNVTIPHKRAALALSQIASVAPAAQAIGAVNTLTVQPDGTLAADNTDWRGFTRALEQHSVPVQDARCLVLGTGGSARAVIYALAQGGARSVTQVSRDPSTSPSAIGYDALAALGGAEYTIINCTPVGMHPDTDRSPWPDSVPFPPRSTVYDLVYNPDPTRLVREARAQGMRACTGLDMLVWQGVYAFALWTGHTPPFDVMFRAAQAALYGE